MNALIGHSGFVGSILKKKYRNWHLYNSKNISKIRYKNYSEIICAGLPAAKWKANKYPKKDKNNLNKLIRNITLVNCKLFILISTIDIYKRNETYGINRKKLELFVKKKFTNYLIFRLPAVFGKGLKKNILFDLLNNNQINNGGFASFQRFNNNNNQINQGGYSSLLSDSIIKGTPTNWSNYKKRKKNGHKY